MRQDCFLLLRPDLRHPEGLARRAWRGTASGFEERSLIDVEKTFHQHEILLTGANGFLGKVIFGLLIDRYPGRRHVHVLIRPRGDRTPRERFEREVLDSPALREIVERLGRERLAERTTVWGGDAGQPLCGFEKSDLVALEGRIGLVLNCAGLVDFFAPVDQSLRANVNSVEQTAAPGQTLGREAVARFHLLRRRARRRLGRGNRTDHGVLSEPPRPRRQPV